ncbi:hypothetical protein [Paracoccus beibuensis]|uniref:hypothetical protein n=1 Tax=Paracoccus beibuensis TaxID=547602 RepID=UPI00223F154C|nr:hypothetical protein [Paracoccus beibuensis]
MSKHGNTQPNLLIVAQAGRLEYEALIFLTSLRAAAPDWTAPVIVAEPLPEGAWAGHDTRISQPCRDLLTDLGAQIRPFVAEHFGAAYPQGNKIEALALLPPAEPFVFFDTDTLVTGPLDRVPFDFGRPSASMRREGTWPKPPLYGPGFGAIWKSIYDRFGLDFASTLDLSQPDEHWERYLYFNAGWFFGADSAEFGRRFLNWALALRDDPHNELACQVMVPWLDQVVLPPVVHSLGGGRPGPELDGLDGDITCHYRKLPLLYALQDDTVIERLETAVADRSVKRVLREWEPARKLIYQEKGRQKVRPIFADRARGTPEKQIRNQLKSRGWWLV